MEDGQHNSRVTNSLPTGTVTFLFTDLEGSTQLLRRLREKYAWLLSEQRRILRAAFSSWNGHEVDTQGDSFFVAFPRATDAVAAASDIQRILAEQQWPAGERVLVRMGLHTGEPWSSEEGYTGMDVHRAARIAHVGHGGQVLLSETTAALVRDDLPEGVTLQELGRHRLKDIEYPEQIQQLVIEGMQSNFPPLKSLETVEAEKERVPNNLPVPKTPFVGRQRELSELEELIAEPDSRIVTIVGPGGMGKTRLALAMAYRQAKPSSNGSHNTKHRFPHGVFFIALDALDSPTQILPALQDALSFRPLADDPAGRSVQRQTLDYLRDKCLLLVMDNFEHLLDGIDLLAAILEADRDVKFLVTSRERLSMAGEQLYPLAGMYSPEITTVDGITEQVVVNYAAPRLFIQSARRICPDFKVESSEVPELIKICRLVGGIPLALELAAGWVELLPLADIAAEIGESGDFLETELRDIPDRHRSMNAVIEGTWNRLNQDEQTLFKQLSIFNGGFTRQAARKVAGASLRQLAGLTGKSLLQYDRSRDRHQVHPLLRQFAAERLALDKSTEQQTRERHMTFFCSASQNWDERLKDGGQLEALSEMEDDIANINVAWRYAVEQGKVAQLDQALDGMSRFYQWRRRFPDGESACRQAEAKLSWTQSVDESSRHAVEGKRILARIKTWHSVFCERNKAREIVEQVLRMLEDLEMTNVDTRKEMAFAMRRKGDLVSDAEQDGRRRHYQQSLELYRDIEDPWETANVLTILGWVDFHGGEVDEARRLGQEALLLCRSTGDQRGTADTLWLLGTLAIVEGAVEESIRLLSESFDIRDTIGDPITDIAVAPGDPGMALTWIGRMEEADAFREATLALFEAIDLPDRVAAAHVRLATSKGHIGDYDAAYHHASLGLELCRKANNQHMIGLAQWLLAGYSLVSGELDQAEILLRESIASYQEVGGAAEIGWTFVSYAELLRRQDRHDLAKEFLFKALRTAYGALGFVTMLFSVCVWANILADMGHEEQAVDMMALADMHPVVGKSVAAMDLFFLERFAEIAKTLPPDLVAEIEARGRARDLKETALEILAQLDDEIEV